MTALGRGARVLSGLSPRVPPGGRAWARRNKVLRNLVRRYRAGRWLTDWRRAAGRELVNAPPAPSTRRKVLLGTNIGGYLHGSIVEAALAAALSTRGHEVQMLLCDAVLPACMECTYVQLTPDEMSLGGPQTSLCGFCHATGVKAVDGLDVTVHSYSKLITTEELTEAKAIAAGATLESVASLELDGLRVGEHALAGALRYFARATLDGEPQAEAVLRRYVAGAVVAARVAQRLIRQERYDVAVFHHGIYVPQGILGEVCRAEGVRVVTWNPAYRSGTFVFSHEDTYHHTLMDEPTSTWEAAGWDKDREQKVMEYLSSRWTGSQDWIWFHERPETDVSAIEAELGIDFSARPTIGLLTNVMWDAQLHYPANAFPTMRDWVVETVRWFSHHPELQLIVRVHPAEVTGWLPSRQLVVEEIRREFPDLPENVYLAGPQSSVSTYAAMLECDSVIIYGTKTGVELAALGVPVIVAGEAWIRGKGVTTDIGSMDEYLDVLRSLPFSRRMEPELITRARQYAYHFFFRRMIPLPFMRTSGVRIPVYVSHIEDLRELQPGTSAGLDIVCDGIVEGTPFVYPAETLEPASGS